MSMKRLNSTVTMVQLGPTLLSEKSDIRLTRNMADRSAENHRVGNISISAWHLEDRAEQRMSLSHIPESVGGRVRADGGGGAPWRPGRVKVDVMFPVCADDAAC